jgi:hypothetical protein
VALSYAGAGAERAGAQPKTPAMDEPVSEDRLDSATDLEYAAVCPMAVVALIVGVLGATALVAGPRVGVPVVAIVLGLVSLRTIRRSEGVVVGRRLALAAVVLGVATGALGGGYHLSIWLGERQTFEDLKRRSAETIDAIVASRYEEVFEQLPADSLQGKAGLASFRKGIRDLFEGGGSLVGRELMSLQILPTERGVLVAPAATRVTLDRRILEMTLWFRLEEDGHWRLVGVGGQETFESMAKYGDEGSPAEVPAPYERGPGRSR